MGTTASPNPQTVQLTSHLMATTTFAGDALMTATTDFTVFGQLLWAAMVNLASPNCLLVQDMSVDGVTMKAGAGITLKLFGTTETVTFTGTVVDGGAGMAFANQMLAQWSPPAAAARPPKKPAPRRKQPPRR